MRVEATAEEWGKLYQLGIQFKNMQPWKKMGDDELIAIRFSPEETAYFSIMGNGGYMYGFSMYIGEKGLNGMLGIMRGERLGIDVGYLFMEQDCISMFISGKDEVPPEQEEIIHTLGLRFRGEHSWIYFERYEKGFSPYMLDQEEVRVCTRYLDKLLEALKSYKREKVRALYQENKIYVYSQEEGEWRGRIEELKENRFKIPKLELTDPKQIRMLKEKKKTKAIWEIDCRPMNERTWDDAYVKPVWPRMFLVMDHKKGYGIDYYLMKPEDGAETAASKLCGLIMEHGCPKKVIVPNVLIENMVGGICEVCGIELVVGKTPCADSFFDDYDNEAGSFDEEQVMQGLTELGFDIDQLKEDAVNMSQEDFMTKVMGEMLDLFESADMDSYEDEFMEYDLKNRKQKVDMVKSFFTEVHEDKYGYVYEPDGMEMLKSIEVDWTCDWEELLMQSSKSRLLDMALNMGASVSRSSSKGVLAKAVMDLADADGSRILGLLSDAEREMLEDLVYAVEDMEAGWDYEDFPYTMEQVLRVVELGLMDVGYLEGGMDRILQLKPVEELREFFAG